MNLGPPEDLEKFEQKLAWQNLEISGEKVEHQNGRQFQLSERSTPY
jgi:hypothetical protein